MIEGLKFDITTAELAKHLETKVAHHKERSAFYEDKVNALQAGGAEAMEYSGGDPVRALRDKGNSHRAKVELFTFLREHLIQQEVYRLEETDLMRLEIVSRGNW